MEGPWGSYRLEPRSDMCQAHALPAALLLWPLELQLSLVQFPHKEAQDQKKQKVAL